jgi:alpha-L-fucosidase
MKINGEAIHGSKPLAPYESGNIHFTQADDEKTQYAFYLSDKDDVALPAQVTLQKFEAPAKAKISLLGSGAKLKWKVENGNTIIEIPSLVRNKWSGKHAVVFKMMR